MDVGTYDTHLARDIATRDATHDAHQSERDARRADYDNALRDMPLTLALRALRVPTSDQSQSAYPRRAPKMHTNWSDGTCHEHGKPWVGKYRCRVCDITKNAWESRGAHMGAHKAPNHACPTTLVKCHHKW